MMYGISIKPKVLVEHWRDLAEYWHISESAQQRLEWLIFYNSVGNQDARGNSHLFWYFSQNLSQMEKRFNPKIIQSLEEKSRAPIKRRVWEVTLQKKARIVLYVIKPKENGEG